jgi:O-antigen ligase
MVLLFWTITGMYLGPVIYGIIPITLLSYKTKDKYQEILLGFFYMLILSDSRQASLSFAENAKNVYIVMMVLFLFSRKSFSPFNKLVMPYIPFFLVAYISIFFAPPEIIGIAIEKTTSYLFLIMVVSNYVQYCYKKHGADFFKILIYFGASILAVGFVLRVINPAQTIMEGRYRGMLGNPNGLGIFALLFFLLFSLINDIYPKLLNRKEKNFIYIVIILSILLSGSRTSLFAIIIYLLFSYAYRYSPFIGFMLFVILAGSYQYITTNIVNIITSLGLTNYLRADTITEASGRFLAWRFAWENIKQSLFIGRGFEYTNYLFIVLNSKYLGDLGHQGNAHNSYLTLWLDTGLLGLLAYVTAFIIMFLKSAKKSKLAIPILYAVIFCSFFESWLTASLNPFTIQLFIILSILTTGLIIPQKDAVAIPV